MERNRSEHSQQLGHSPILEAAWAEARVQENMTQSSDSAKESVCEQWCELRKILWSTGVIPASSSVIREEEEQKVQLLPMNTFSKGDTYHDSD